MDIVIASIVRTAVGSFGGSLKDVSARTLGTVVIREALARAGLDAAAVDQVFMGCVLQAGLGQNVARQAAVDAGIPLSSPAVTINQVCGSGLRAIALAADLVRVGEAEIIVAGGTENMSAAPYALPGLRWGARMGDTDATDLMVHDGLWEIFNGYHMGVTAENLARQYGITREEQDAFACTSQNRAEAAIQEGRFEAEIVPISIPQRKGEPRVFSVDEFPRRGVTTASLAALKPAFLKDGTVTAGNASGINDGAAAAVVMGAAKAASLGITPLATIRATATAGVDPSVMGLGPVPATRKVLARAGLGLGDIELIEANEAFAAQSLAVARDLELPLDHTNVNGGAIALGHPIGASGARILCTLIHEMRRRDVRRGLATLCVGGGMGVSMVVER
ncbi:MAG: acetyl-CoA C-acetyltransferase [Deltaproteobacteria bacterium]|nr:acetyl-CoA C-acetyltransferase [Deltaproteobacteria bacterium]